MLHDIGGTATSSFTWKDKLETSPAKDTMITMNIPETVLRNVSAKISSVVKEFNSGQEIDSVIKTLGLVVDVNIIKKEGI